MDYKSMKIEDIIEWCKANNQVAWLKETAAQEIATEEGTRKISFIELKLAFVRKFMAEIAPKAAAPKKPSMYDMIAAL